jgi:heme exporter protein C
MKNWYKIAGVLILLYSFTVGMLVPLSPGITAVTPQSFRTGDTATIRVKGYNSHYQSNASALKAWLKLNDEFILPITNIQVESETDLILQVDIPKYLPVRERVQDFALVLNNPTDGASVLPSAIFITQDSLDPNLGKSLWEATSIDNLNEREFTTYPFRNILQETIRNTYFHVSLWFAMIFLLIAAVWNAVAYLRTEKTAYDIKSVAFTEVGLLFGLLGLATGAIWAKYTWGQFWSWDVKQNTTAVALLIYCAYFVLRQSFEDQAQKARISAVYSVFSFVALIILIYVIPRMTDSLHPGNGGNPAFGGEDLDNTMRMVFYPAIIGWTMFGIWIASILSRAGILKEKMIDQWQ